MSQPKYLKFDDVSEFIIKGIYKNSERYVVLTFSESGSAETIARVVLSFRDAGDNQYSFDFETNQFVAIGGHFCALVEDEDDTEYKCYRLYYSKDQYVLIKTSCSRSDHLIINRMVCRIDDLNPKDYHTYKGPFDYRSEIPDEQDQSNELISSSPQNSSNLEGLNSNEMDISSETSSSGVSSNTLEDESDDLDFLEQKLNEKRLQKVNQLDEKINDLLSQVSALEQELSSRIRPLKREAKELQIIQEKIVRKIYPIIYRIKVQPFAKSGTGYFTSYQKAQDIINLSIAGRKYPVKWEYSIFSIASNEIKKAFFHLIDEMPENKLWVNYTSP